MGKELGRQTVDQAGRSTERSETVSNETAKSDEATKASARPAEATSAVGATEHQPAGNNAQATTGTKPAASKPAKPYEDAETYLAFMHDSLDAAKNKPSVMELWGASRADRNELLASEQIEDLTKYKDAKLAALKAKDVK